LLALIALGCVACGSGRAAESEALVPREVGNLDGSVWMLGLTDDTTNVPTKPPVTIAFADDSASGKGPCNNYNLPFTHDGKKVTTGPIAATKIACSTAVMAAERRYFHALEAVDHADKEMHRLVLTGPGGIRLVYTRVKDDAAS
jgi:heat shock protein HslJ